MGRLFRYIVLAILCSGFLGACKQRRSYADLNKANQFARDGLYREAIDNYKKAMRYKAKRHVVNRNLGMVYVKTGNYKKAETHLRKSKDKYINNFENNFYLGEALRAQNKFADAIFHYQKALSVKPQDYKAMKSLSWSFFKIRYYSEALKTAKQLIKKSPQDPQANIILARTLIKLKRSNLAYKSLRRIEKSTSPKSRPYIASVMGDALYEMKNTSKAMKAYKFALKGQPLLAGALLGFGRCLLKANKVKDAVTYLERAVRSKPNLIEGHYLLGRVYEKVNSRKSIKYYNRFRKLAVSDPEYIAKSQIVKSRVVALRNKSQTKK